MNVETQQAVAAKPKIPDVEHHRLIGVAFHKALQFGGVIEAASLAKGFTITPAKLTSTLDWRECKADESPTHIGLTKMAKTPQGGRVVMRAATPMSNISEFSYGE